MYSTLVLCRRSFLLAGTVPVSCLLQRCTHIHIAIVFSRQFELLTIVRSFNSGAAVNAEKTKETRIKRTVAKKAITMSAIPTGLPSRTPYRPAFCFCFIVIFLVDACVGLNYWLSASFWSHVNQNHSVTVQKIGLLPPVLQVFSSVVQGCTLWVITIIFRSNSTSSFV